MDEDKKEIFALRDRFKQVLLELLEADPQTGWTWAMQVVHDKRWATEPEKRPEVA